MQQTSDYTDLNHRKDTSTVNIPISNLLLNHVKFLSKTYFPCIKINKSASHTDTQLTKGQTLKLNSWDTCISTMCFCLISHMHVVKWQMVLLVLYLLRLQSVQNNNCVESETTYCNWNSHWLNLPKVQSRGCNLNLWQNNQRAAREPSQLWKNLTLICNDV